MAVRDVTTTSRPATQVQAPRGARPTTRPGATDITRGKIVDATVALLDRLAYRAITIDAIARAAGVGKSTIYRYWPSRQRLVLEAYTRRTSGLIAVPDTGDVVEDLRTYLGQLAFCLDFDGAASTVSGLIVDAIQDPDFGVLYRQVLLRERRDAFETMLVRGQSRGQVRTDIDLEVAVDALYGAVHHRMLVSRQIIDGPFVKSLVDVATTGLLPTSARPRTAR